MKSILDLLFSNYFTIDQEKENLYEPQKVDKEGATRQIEDSEDLITLISHVMVENERLQNIRYELENRSGSPDKMGSFMRRMITFLDGFERVLNFARQYPPSKDVDNWLKSVETVYFRLLNVLEKYGLKSLDTLGKPVNLNYHDVVEYRSTLDYPPDTIISERHKGYLLNGKLIRDAKVVVAYNPASG